MAKKKNVLNILKPKCCSLWSLWAELQGHVLVHPQPCVVKHTQFHLGVSDQYLSLSSLPPLFFHTAHLYLPHWHKDMDVIATHSSLVRNGGYF